MSHLACMHTSKVSKDETPSEVSSVYHKELVTNTIIDEKNLRDKLRLMSALFPGMIISPFSSLIGCSRSGLGNSTTSGCYKKRQILRITTQINHGWCHHNFLRVSKRYQISRKIKMRTLLNLKNILRMLDTRYSMDIEYPKHVFFQRHERTCLLKTSNHLFVYACIFFKCVTDKSITKFSQYKNGLILSSSYVMKHRFHL